MDTPNATGSRSALTARNLLLGSRALADALTGAAIVGLITLFWLVPAALLLPALSLYAIACAMAAAAFAWRSGATWHSRRDDRGITAWDISGACVLIGIAAGMLSEPETAAQLLGLAAKDQ